LLGQFFRFGFAVLENEGLAPFSNDVPQVVRPDAVTAAKRRMPIGTRQARVRVQWIDRTRGWSHGYL